MHSHDRTLLSRLGFADPDKKDPKHDWACQYIAVLAETGKLGLSLLAPLVETIDPPRRYFEFRGDVLLSFLSTCTPKIEHMLSKGDGQYRTTIGFLDVMIPFRFQTHHRGDAGPPSNRMAVDDRDTWQSLAIFEVKIQPVGTGDMIRQINLYKQYIDRSCIHGEFWFIASAFPLPAIDVETLKRERIRHVFLGDSFTRWREERAKIASRDSLEL